MIWNFTQSVFDELQRAQVKTGWVVTTLCAFVVYDYFEYVPSSRERELRLDYERGMSLRNRKIMRR